MYCGVTFKANNKQLLVKVNSSQHPSRKYVKQALLKIPAPCSFCFISKQYFGNHTGYTCVQRLNVWGEVRKVYDFLWIHKLSHASLFNSNPPLRKREAAV
jgi:hypothetical protein